MSQGSQRKADYPIDKLFTSRWSPRALTGEEISHDQLMTLLEAGRWAPSSYNNQPWHFIYGFKGTPAWDKLFGLLVEFNQSWACNASALVCVISKKIFDLGPEHDATGKPSRTHSFDAGAAWMSVALQAASSGFVVHGMEGFNYEKTKQELNIPSEYEVEMMFAVGKQASKEVLPEGMQEDEKPSDRNHLSSMVSEGVYTIQ